MTKFVVQEYDVTITLQIATYYPGYVVENISKIHDAVTSAVNDKGKHLDYLAGASTISIKERANETTT